MKYFLATLCLAAASAQAHIGLEYQVAPANSSYKATFTVGHGCAASATRQISVQVPPAMRNAHPMPKPGWTIELQREGDVVTRVTWTAKSQGDALPSAHYDEFVLVAQAPAQPGSVSWPVAQLCDEGRHDWTPKLEILPAAGAGHQH